MSNYSLLDKTVIRFVEIFSLFSFYIFFEQLYDGGIFGIFTFGYFVFFWYLNKISLPAFTSTMCEFCWELTIKTPKRRYWRRSDVFINDFEETSYIFMVLSLLASNKQMATGINRENYNLYQSYVSKGISKT